MNDEESLAAEYRKFTQVCTEVMDSVEKQEPRHRLQRRSEHIAAVKEKERKWEESNTDSEAERKAKWAEFRKAKQAARTKDYVSWVAPRAH